VAAVRVVVDFVRRTVVGDADVGTEARLTALAAAGTSVRELGPQLRGTGTYPVGKLGESLVEQVV
jgi:hypothetical protein